MGKNRRKKPAEKKIVDRITVTLYVTAEMKAQLMELSKKNGRSETKQVITMIDDWLAGNVCNSNVPKAKKLS